MPDCSHVGITSAWCQERCKHKTLAAHERTKCAGPARRSINLDDEASYRHFCPPACRIEIVTPRLRLRPVEMSDTPRVFKIKNDPLVSDMQLYGRVASESSCRLQFVTTYVSDNIPSLKPSFPMPETSRTRYVFAIEPRVSKDDGTRMVQPRPWPGARHELDANGYIGNIALELTTTGQGGPFFNRSKRFDPKVGEIFTFPEREEIKDTVEGTIFYELHPNFWRQGIMSEAFKAVLAFAFQTLRLSTVVVDPQEFNAGSIALAEAHGFEHVGDKTAFTGARQRLYRLGYAGWDRARGAKKKKNNRKKTKKEKDEPVVVVVAPSAQEAVVLDDPDDSARPTERAIVERAAVPPDAPVPTLERKCCRWCQVPSSTTGATLGCSGCDWAFWCGQPCKTADLTYLHGHSVSCASSRTG
ncbi:hypothetical protein JCM11491_004409 [Sporobolomyces phaffii]